MKKTVIRYGLYGAITICGLFLLGLFLGKLLDLSYSLREVIGYSSMVISLCFVFFGIKHYRDSVNNGLVSFGKALIIGVLVSLIAAVAFGILDVIYIEFMNPNFAAEYYDFQLTELQSTFSGAELEGKISAMEAEKEMFSSTTFNFIIMTMTVFVIGFIISLLSALILQRK
jgi:putative flippase GtrA